MIKTLWNMAMAGSLALSIPQITVLALEGTNFVTGAERSEIRETYDLARAAINDPAKLVQLCPKVQKLMKDEDLHELCAALANGGAPEVIMARAQAMLSKLQVASR